MNGDGAAFIRAAMGGPTRPIDDAILSELTRTPVLREQLQIVRDAAALLDEIGEAQRRVREILERQVREFNRQLLAQIAHERGRPFDA